jgi:hypothetical protein
MENQPRYAALAQWLRALLESGVTVSEAVLVYLEATFGTDDLAAVLTDEPDCEIDSLMDLVFFPEKTTQVQFEDHWGDTPFSATDLDLTIRHLCAAPIAVPLKGSPPHGDAFVIRVPDFALASFVQRLNIAWQPDRHLAQTLDHDYRRELCLSLRVMLRNAPLAWNRGQVQLTSRFLSHMPPASEALEPLLDFLLSLLYDLTGEVDFFAFLIGKKGFYFQSLCKAEDYERRRQSSNMETMMLQGARSAHGSIEQWQLYMRNIDRICQALFGRTHFFHQPTEQCIALENNNGEKTMQNVIRVLS